jgi:putative FmdB family regulatory protein
MTYEYLCTACGHAWEAEQSISAAPLKSCPNCHEETARRQVSGGAGFILKGGGWYSDLYSSAPKKGAEDAKPAAKADATPAKTESTASDSSSKGSDKGSSGSSGSSGSGSSGTPSSTPTSGTPSGSKATGAVSGA